MRTIRGTFQNRTTMSNAVRGLSEKSVPADMIDVQVIDADGNMMRQVEVEDEAGTLRGAIIGGICGALIGIAVIVFELAGGLGPDSTGTPGNTALGGAVRLAISVTLGGIPLGAIIGLGYWNGRTKVSKREMREGSVVVSVESDELAETARGVFEDAGAVAVREASGLDE